MEGLSFSKSERRTFHETPYVLSISGDNESLAIEVEHAEDSRRWRAKFAARFIEEITQRTGNAKKFDVFVRMLLSALAQESDAVYLDVLTARDLEMLRRHANPQGPPTTSTAGQSDKRYMILTYRAEFDKVHYPLPLPLDERTEEETLRATVARLRNELSQAHSSIAQLEIKASAAPPPPPVQAVDDARLERLERLEQANAELSNALDAARKEAEQLQKELRLRSIPDSRQRDGASDSMEVHRLRSEVTKLKAETKSLKDEMRQRELTAKRLADKVSAELKQERLKAERLAGQVRKIEEERRAMSSKLQAATRNAANARSQSGERSRPASRTPSAERARAPPSRPLSRTPTRPSSRPSGPPSRASSVASSRERTPSPSSFNTGARGRAGSGGSSAANPPDYRRPSLNRSGSPGAFRDDRGGNSPGGRNSSPYRQSAAPGRRTPSPGQRSRERTPSPGSRNGGHLQQGPPRAAMTLRDRGGLNNGSVNGVQKPISTRYGGGGSSRPSSASRLSGQAVRHGNAAAINSGLDMAFDGRGQVASHGVPPREHQPGSLFGLAANLGLGPGSSSPGAGAVAASLGASSNEDDACDIDARLQALQSFLKQTKNMGN
eukprot:TRINITY_DN22672_c0_g1_i3.p1 TRINITY_DN22672_c0_g1~~TRINITY_DN22672_c0_g1_i3.p1  ORF type:complete len:609 (+),score=129.30 TRINITY_DN22672_c0_g1_i3:53-1879(+)